MSDFLKQKLKKKEQRKANLGCALCILFLFAFWSLIIWVGVRITFPIK